MPAQFIRVIPHSQLRRTDFYGSMLNSSDARWLPDVCCAFYIIWSHCAEAWFAGKIGADGSVSPRELEWLLDRRRRTTQKIIEVMVAHGWLLERTDGRLELAGFCLFFGAANGAPRAQARLRRGSGAQHVEQNQALDPPLDLDQDLHTTTHTQHPPENPPARERVHSADVGREEVEAVHPNEPEPPHPADDPAHEPPPKRELKPTRRADGVCVSVKKHENPVKPKPHLTVVPATLHQTREDAPQASQEVIPMSEPTPAPSRPLEANVEPLAQDEPDEPFEVWAERTRAEAQTPAAREAVENMIATMQRIGVARLQEGAAMGAERDRQQREAEAAVAAEKARKAREEAMNRRPLGFPDFRCMLGELGIPGSADATKYRLQVTVGLVRRIVEEIRAQAARDPNTSLNAGLVLYRCQAAMAAARQRHEEGAMDANAAAVVSQVASGLRVGYDPGKERKTA